MGRPQLRDWSIEPGGKLRIGLDTGHDLEEDEID